MNILIFSHLGLGDQFIMNGYINFLLLDNKINKIKIIAKKYQEKTLTHLYSDLPAISFFWIDIKDENSEWMNIPIIVSINRKPFNTQILLNDEIYFLQTFGLHSPLDSFIVEGRSWADSFYIRTGVDPTLRYDLFKLPANLERSKYLYTVLREQIQSDNYILIHDDPSRGRVVRSELVKSILKKNSTLDLPVIYLGKNRDAYPFIEGLNNVRFPYFASIVSLLDLYHIILHSTECHFMDSSIACLTDTMDNVNTNLYIHYYITYVYAGCERDVHKKRAWTCFHD
jgi:hypothetical protein